MSYPLPPPVPPAFRIGLLNNRTLTAGGNESVSVFLPWQSLNPVNPCGQEGCKLYTIMEMKTKDGGEVRQQQKP